MNHRELLEIDSTLRGRTGQWLYAELKKTAEEVLKEVRLMVPENLRDMNDREQLIGKANALLELVEQIPLKLNELIKEAKEKTNEQ